MLQVIYIRYDRYTKRLDLALYSVLASGSDFDPDVEIFFTHTEQKILIFFFVCAYIKHVLT